MKNIILQILGLVIVVAVCIYWYYIRFSNPDMTETRLLITFWKQEFATIIACIFAGILFNYEKK